MTLRTNVRACLLVPVLALVAGFELSIGAQPPALEIQELDLQPGDTTIEAGCEALSPANVYVFIWRTPPGPEAVLRLNGTLILFHLVTVTKRPDRDWQHRRGDRLHHEWVSGATTAILDLKATGDCLADGNCDDDYIGTLKVVVKKGKKPPARASVRIQVHCGC